MKVIMNRTDRRKKLKVLVKLQQRLTRSYATKTQTFAKDVSEEEYESVKSGTHPDKALCDRYKSLKELTEKLMHTNRMIKECMNG
jgi:hypothetical protein